ncbi:hypothetical protein FE257_001373 [Aspergillus nanangensis]|uniref:Uncharacterized protein n=1 Tax=Aspergillus nanangensis TaxID=2582783 RepID=A0AAD4GPR1_ASPNN|nr:hypothetical protein FE257_001373 [Aspergillus nanangensis]
MSSSHTISSHQNNNDLNSKRRRFQPPITTFFTTSTPLDPADHAKPPLSHTHYAAATYSPTPVVPARVQASLLSVGMRVRKSIAEGYKTKINMITDEKQGTTYSSPKPRTYTTTVHSELAPYSGMSRLNDNNTNSIQPYAEPPTSISYDDGHLITDDGDAFSLPPSSQESAASLPPLSNGQKRSFDYDEDDETIDGRISPSGTSWVDPMERMHVNSTVGRPILAPRLDQQRRRFITVQKQGTGTMDVDDFEEPTFLRKREEVDMEYGRGRNTGYEVQMGGV